MAEKKGILPAAAMEKLLKKAGAARVSNDAKEKMREVLEEVADEIGQRAVRLSKHAGRKTVKSTDVYKASK